LETKKERGIKLKEKEQRKQSEMLDRPVKPSLVSFSSQEVDLLLLFLGLNFPLV
jgi:hypothetical protein